MWQWSIIFLFFSLLLLFVSIFGCLLYLLAPSCHNHLYADPVLDFQITFTIYFVFLQVWLFSIIHLQFALLHWLCEDDFVALIAILAFWPETWILLQDKDKEKEKQGQAPAMTVKKVVPTSQVHPITSKPVTGFFSQYLPRSGMQYYRDLAGNIKQVACYEMYRCGLLLSLQR